MASAFDEYFMRMALREAEKAAADGEVPTGCVIVEEPGGIGNRKEEIGKRKEEIGNREDGELSSVLIPNSYSLVPILGRAHNQTEGLSDATAHAEMLALSAAFAAKGNWRLTGTRLYVTKEPCPMCAGAIVLARVKTVVWGVSDPKRGGGTVFDIFRHPGINHHPEIVTGVCEEESKAVLQEFFRRRREEGRGQQGKLTNPLLTLPFNLDL